MSDFDDILAAAQRKRGQPSAPKAAESKLPLDAIAQREEDSRPLNPDHVQALADSIAILGLIQPLAVDQAGRLLAGGHRRAALLLLQEQNPEAFAKHFPSAQIPVRIMPFDSAQQPDLALEIELSENEKRRDYTPAEVRAIADKLRAAGYRDSTGRPKKGEKQLRPALTVIFGKSIATVRRYLNEPDEKSHSHERVSSDLLKRSLKTLQQWQQQHGESPTAEEAELLKLLPKVEKAIARVLKKETKET
jgi:ParB family transcriptional regulator, chromosome partitioning protein